MFQELQSYPDDEGILYIATEQRFVDEAILSAQTVKNTMGDVSIGLITSEDVDLSPIFDITIQSDGGSNDFGEKVYNMNKTPFKKTIYLDTDIYLEESVTEIFEILKKWDIAASHNIGDYNFGDAAIPDDHPLQDLPDGVREYNSGVIGYRCNDLTSELFKAWKEEYEADQKVVDHPPDQASFRRALFNSNVRIHTLPREYNCLFRSLGCVNSPVKVFHGRLKDIDGLGANMAIDVEEAINEINKKDGKRIYYTCAQTTVALDTLDEILLLGLRLLRQGQFKKLARLGLQFGKS